MYSRPGGNNLHAHRVMAPTPVLVLLGRWLLVRHHPTRGCNMPKQAGPPANTFIANAIEEVQFLITGTSCRWLNARYGASSYFEMNVTKLPWIICANQTSGSRHDSERGDREACRFVLRRRYTNMQ